MIRGYIGNLGSGKTYSMIAEARTWLKNNRGQVYINMAGVKCPEAIFVGNLSEMLTCRSGLLLLDEASVSVSSRFFHETAREVLTRFAQLRKHGMDLYYTTQHEDRVDKVLREITNEYVHLTKFFRTGFNRRVYLPGKKEPVSSLYHRYDPVVFGLFDTFEVISTEGGSMGRASASPAMSTVARSTQCEDDAAASRAAVQAEIPMMVWQGNVPTYTPAAQAALEYLLNRGFYDPSVDRRVQLQRELKRRRWLRHWGLAPDDAPHTCTPENPWLEGFDPASVMDRLAARQAEEAEAALVEYARQQAVKNLARADARGSRTRS